MNSDTDHTAVPVPSETIFDYLINYNATFVNGWMPSPGNVFPGCPEISSVGGNSYVIPGGNNKLVVNYQDDQHDVVNVLYGVVGAYGYYKLDVSPQSSSYSVVVILSQLLKKNYFIIELCLEDMEGNISKPYYIPVQMVTAQPGDLQISLSFDQHNDLDLHVVEPDGFEIYWNDTLSPNGGMLDLDANANCNYDSVNNENVIYNDSIPLGCFKIYIHYYRQCIYGVNTNFSVTALFNGEPVALIDGSNPYNGVFPDGFEGYYVQAMSFDLGDAFRVGHFQYERFAHAIVKQEIVTEKPPE